MTAMMRARAGGRSCLSHGDNGCENRGAAGRRTRAQESREVRLEIESEAP